jgi:hypothetical protein
MIYIEQKMYNPIKCITGSSYRNIDKASKIICEIYRDLRAPGESIPTWIRTVSALTSIFALSSIASYYRTEDITKSIVTGAMISLIPAFISITKKIRKIRTYKDYPFLVANHGFKSLYSMATELVEHKNDE